MSPLFQIVSVFNLQQNGHTFTQACKLLGVEKGTLDGWCKFYFELTACGLIKLLMRGKMPNYKRNELVGFYRHITRDVDCILRKWGDKYYTTEITELGTRTSSGNSVNINEPVHYNEELYKRSGQEISDFIHNTLKGLCDVRMGTASRSKVAAAQKPRVSATI